MQAQIHMDSSGGKAVVWTVEEIELPGVAHHPERLLR